MTFRLRLTLLAAGAVAVAIVGTSFAVYYTDRSALIGQTDSDLEASLTIPPLGPLGNGPISIRGVAQGRQAGAGAGKALQVSPPPGIRQVVLPGSLRAVDVSVGPKTRWTKVAAAPSFTSTTIRGVRSRVLSLTVDGRRIQVTSSLIDVDRNLARLRWLLVFISLGGIGVAAVLGALVSKRAVAPLRRLTETTEQIVETGDLSRRTAARGRDEISRLSARLDELLGTLDASLRTQRQLVADASHELRTPIATLRANFELLAEPGILDPAERAELLTDVRDELESMTALVGELVELARGEEADFVPREFRLDEVVQGAVDRAARRAPALSFRTSLQPSLVTGVPERIDRAVSNLLDNARKWSPADETVDVAVHDGLVEVRDRGPGIAPEDQPLVFNRFYRSATARGMPGAGLGLAIVKQIADAHGGSVTVDEAAGGGAILCLRLSSCC